MEAPDNQEPPPLENKTCAESSDGCRQIDSTAAIAQNSRNRLDRFLQDHNSVRFPPNNSTDVCFSLGTSSSSGGRTTKCNSCSSAFAQLWKTEFLDSGDDWGRANEESKLEKVECDESDDNSWIANMLPSSSQRRQHAQAARAANRSTLRPPRDRLNRFPTSSWDQQIEYDIFPTPSSEFLTNEEWVALREQRYQRLDVSSRYINSNRIDRQVADDLDLALTDRISLVHTDGSRIRWRRPRTNRISGRLVTSTSVWLAAIPSWRSSRRSHGPRRFNRAAAADNGIQQNRFRWPEPNSDEDGEEFDDNATAYWSTGTAFCEELSCFDGELIIPRF